MPIRTLQIGLRHQACHGIRIRRGQARMAQYRSDEILEASYMDQYRIVIALHKLP